MVQVILLLAAALVAQAPPAFAVGARIHTIGAVYARTDTLGVGTKVLRTVGSTGMITGGPAGSSTVYGVSWYIHYDTPPDGWSTQQYLAVDSVVSPPPPPPPPLPVGGMRTVTIGGLPVSIGVTVGQAVEYAALPLDSTNTLTAAPVTWSAADSTVVKITHPLTGLSQAAGLTALRVGSTTVTASAAGLTRSMTFTGLPADTAHVLYMVAGIQVTNLPSRPYFGLLPAKPIYSGTYLVNLIGVMGDTLKHAVLVVPK